MSQLQLIQHQLQQRLDEWKPLRFEVVLDAKTTLFVCDQAADELDILWVIDTLEAKNGETGDDFLTRSLRRSLPCARQAIADYWLLSPSRLELRTYALPSEQGYLQKKLHQIGATVSPSVMPAITVTLRSPEPVCFFTRKLNGQRIHTVQTPPLQVCAQLQTGSR